MFNQFGRLNVRLSREGRPTTGQVNVPPKRRLILASMALALCACSTVAVWGSMKLARMQNTPRIVEPASNLLPGNPLPASIRCASAFERRFECRTSEDGEVVYLTTDSSAQVILHTSITARHQTIGNVIAAWGAPSSIARFGNALYVYWGQRWVYLFTCRFEPASPIEFIGYGLAASSAAQQKQLPWRGFTDDGHYACADSLHYR